MVGLGGVQGLGFRVEGVGFRGGLLTRRHGTVFLYAYIYIYICVYIYMYLRLVMFMCNYLCLWQRKLYGFGFGVKPTYPSPLSNRLPPSMVKSEVQRAKASANPRLTKSGPVVTGFFRLNKV